MSRRKFRSLCSGAEIKQSTFKYFSVSWNKCRFRTSVLTDRMCVQFDTSHVSVEVCANKLNTTSTWRGSSLKRKVSVCLFSLHCKSAFLFLEANSCLMWEYPELSSLVVEMRNISSLSHTDPGAREPAENKLSNTTVNYTNKLWKHRLHANS